MKVFALGLFAKPLTDEQRKRILPKEVPDTLKLYLDGKIDQFWFREDKPGGVDRPLVGSRSCRSAGGAPNPSLHLTAAALRRVGVQRLTCRRGR
jgi:hypothetical protein